MVDTASEDTNSEYAHFAYKSVITTLPENYIPDDPEVPISDNDEEKKVNDATTLPSKVLETIASCINSDIRHILTQSGLTMQQIFKLSNEDRIKHITKCNVNAKWSNKYILEKIEYSLKYAQNSQIAKGIFIYKYIYINIYMYSYVYLTQNRTTGRKSRNISRLFHCY